MAGSSLAQYGLVLFLLLVAGGNAIEDEPDKGVTFVPEQFQTCAGNFAAHAQLSVDQCKALCLAKPGCTEFSYPLEDAPSGCRIALSGGCQPRPYDNELSSVYKKKETPKDEPPDLEGVGSRRRRRSDARRRTHNPEKTPQSAEIARIILQAKADQKVRREAEAARLRGEDEAILYHKESEAKIQVAKRTRTWKIKQRFLNQQDDDKNADANKGQAKDLRDLEHTVKAMDATQTVVASNIRNTEQALDVTNSQKVALVQRITLAKTSIETLMNDPGKLADQDRQIAIAILGKLRVAKALVNGDMVSLKPEQDKLPWVVRLSRAMKKAIRHPSKENLASATAAYKQASFSSTQGARDAAAALGAEATRLKEEKEAARAAATLDQNKVKDKAAAAEEAAAIATAVKQAEADKAAAAAAPASAIAIPRAAAVDAVQPDTSDAPTIKKVKRGFFDPIE